MKQPGHILKSLLREIGELSPGCKRAARLQSEAMDHPLSPGQRIGLRIHLALCKWCRRYGKQIRFLRTAAHDHPEKWEESAPRRLSDEARQRLKDSLRSGEK